MVELTDINGIGPSTAEELEEMGYDSVAALASGDKEEVAEVRQVNEDTALGFIVSANDLLEEEEEEQEDGENEASQLIDDTDDESGGEEFDLTPSDVSEELDDGGEQTVEPDESENEETSDESSGASEAAESDSKRSDEPYEVSVVFDERIEYDTFHAALMRYYETVYDSNQSTADAAHKLLHGLDDQESVEYELTEDELNTLHTAVKQQRIDYQGDNLIDEMEALMEVEGQVNEARTEFLG